MTHPLERLGFAEVNTGGGCTALELTLDWDAPIAPGSTWIDITVADGAVAPEPGDDLLIGFYYQGGFVAVAGPMTEADALTALDAFLAWGRPRAVVGSPACCGEHPLVTLTNVEGIARLSGIDPHGNHWIQFDGCDDPEREDAVVCPQCGGPMFTGWLCLDGGDELCGDHVQVERRPGPECEDGADCDHDQTNAGCRQHLRLL